MVTASSVTTLTPSALVKTVPLGMGCGVKRPLYKVRLPVAALASWWPLPVVALVAALVRVTGASWRVCRGSVVFSCTDFCTGQRVTVTTGWFTMAAMLLTSKHKTTLTTKMPKERPTISSSLGRCVGRGCVGISDTARTKIASGLSSSSSPVCCTASGGSDVNGSLTGCVGVTAGLDCCSSTCIGASLCCKTSGGMATAALTWLGLLLGVVKVLPLLVKQMILSEP